ncbi:STAS domain-containing protein [Dactylosporangium matsuzakiense]|uniref:STAS domain-containing protein n=1 Tax=Dactylosporangium matsuzakiense TaxID=53360 RepID=A0A9W6NK35_9ACTN|nr:STAS domain-containing protein [Dactylosporangium matsuzakiense]UWZ42254.1 STAS domain-containing protein [Dactylosporangium matsuzakiense]GLK99908.1 hypothetical protein GCM10017581_016490 [Dactylosporangium matsuzakiense]
MVHSSAAPAGDRELQVAITERLDATTQIRIEAAVERAGEGRPDRIVIDLAACTGADAAGIDALLEAHRDQWRNGRRLALRAVPDPIAQLFTLARLDHVFETEPT